MSWLVDLSHVSRRLWADWSNAVNEGSPHISFKGHVNVTQIVSGTKVPDRPIPEHISTWIPMFTPCHRSDTTINAIVLTRSRHLLQYSYNPSLPRSSARSPALINTIYGEWRPLTMLHNVLYSNDRQPEQDPGSRNVRETELYTTGLASDKHCYHRIS